LGPRRLGHLILAGDGGAAARGNAQRLLADVIEARWRAVTRLLLAGPHQGGEAVQVAFVGYERLITEVDVTAAVAYDYTHRTIEAARDAHARERYGEARWTQCVGFGALVVDALKGKARVHLGDAHGFEPAALLTQERRFVFAVHEC